MGSNEASGVRCFEYVAIGSRFSECPELGRLGQSDRSVTENSEDSGRARRFERDEALKIEWAGGGGRRASSGVRRD
jgi:hypothetical protein